MSENRCYHEERTVQFTARGMCFVACTHGHDVSRPEAETVVANCGSVNLTPRLRARAP